MKKVALVLAIVSVFIMLVSAAAAAIELPLRVEVNGERVYFPDEQPFIDSNGGPGTGEIYSGEVGSECNMDGKEKKAVFEKGSKKLVCT